MPKKTRKNFMEMALSARICRVFHEIFSCPLVFLVVKNCHSGTADALRRVGLSVGESSTVGLAKGRNEVILFTFPCALW